MRHDIRWKRANGDRWRVFEKPGATQLTPEKVVPEPMATITGNTLPKAGIPFRRHEKPQK